MMFEKVTAVTEQLYTTDYFYVRKESDVVRPNLNIGGQIKSCKTRVHTEIVCLRKVWTYLQDFYTSRGHLHHMLFTRAAMDHSIGVLIQVKRKLLQTLSNLSATLRARSRSRVAF